jgi:hypothetical protein
MGTQTVLIRDGNGNTLARVEIEGEWRAAEAHISVPSGSVIVTVDDPQEDDA